MNSKNKGVPTDVASGQLPPHTEKIFNLLTALCQTDPLSSSRLNLPVKHLKEHNPFVIINNPEYPQKGACHTRKRQQQSKNKVTENTSTLSITGFVYIKIKLSWLLFSKIQSRNIHGLRQNKRELR